MVREDGAYPSADPVARPTDALSVLSPVMQPRGVTADVTAQGDSFVPSALSEGEKLIYEALVQECGQLQERLSESRETCAQVEDTMRSLNTQLSEERKLVSDQGQEILRLKEKKHNLTLEIDAKRKGVTKRKKELFYAVSAIQSIDSHVEQKILLQAEQQERTQKSRRHNSAARQKRVSPAPVPKRNKSDILRSEATKNRIQSQKESGDDPYTPNHFRSTAKSSTLARKEWSPCYAEQAENEKEAKPGPPGHARHGADVRTPANGAPPARNNLSALSIEELFEAAASIKKRQLALQQMHSSILNESPFTDGLRPETSSTNSDARQIFSVIVKQQEKNNAEPHDAEAERLSQPSSVSSVVENEVSLTDHIPSGGDDVDTSKEPTNRQLF
ncbi:hypothetical protein ADEAN_000389100 [Angomonas deanei]|uniref:Uncharacterized protein n=1 Tax=Angomonas deanei TaxID=59799 RepID=A0A7G2CA45_9TRYP|nr:hypothetical protein ADEAN_000389100 [Angomonas deanei]